jgi:phosphoserine phosphatase RsbU/P
VSDVALPIDPSQPTWSRVELRMLAELTEAFTDSIDLERTLIEAVHKIAQHMQAEAASLFLLDTAGDLVCRASAGPISVVGLKVRHGHGIVGRTVAQNRVQLIPDVQHDPDYIGSGVRVKGFEPRTMVCAPLSNRQGAMGALQVINKRDGESFSALDADILRVLCVPTTLALSNARLAQDLLQQNRIRREFELARQMQQTLLPKRHAGFPVQAINRPAHEISGDFYDYFVLPDGRIAFAVGDVSGKGMDAALLMVRASSLIRFLGKSGLSPRRWIARANAELCQTVQRGMFVCAVLGIYEPDCGVVELASAGFPPVLLRDNDASYLEIAAHGPPLGVLDDIDYDSSRFCLAGCSMYCYSDGLSDIRGQNGSVQGGEGVRRILESVQQVSMQARLRALSWTLRRQRLPDDTTVLMIDDAQSAPRLLAETGVLSDTDNLRAVRDWLRALLRRLAFLEADIAQLVLAVDEAVANCIRHGYQGAANRRIELRALLLGSELHLQIIDEAPAVDAACIKPRDLDECRAGGLGINLIDMSFDRWFFSAPEADASSGAHAGSGNVLTLVKKVRWSNPDAEDVEKL